MPAVRPLRGGGVVAGEDDDGVDGEVKEGDVKLKENGLVGSAEWYGNA